MKLFKKLGNPFALAVEGFLAGALLFVAANPGAIHQDPGAGSAQSEAIMRQLTR